MKLTLVVAAELSQNQRRLSLLPGGDRNGGFDFQRTLRAAQLRTLSRVSDGGTPVIDQPVRMVSVDTPRRPSTGAPSTAQAKLDRCRQRLQDGTYQALPETLRIHLVERLTQDAAERHINAGIRASQEFQALLDRRLTRPDGVRRKVGSHR